jgi:outer membrane protein
MSMVHKHLVGAAVMAALLFPATAPAHAQQPVPLTQLSVEQALQLARANNPDFQIQRNQIRSAEWRARSASGDLLPATAASMGFGYTAPGQQRFGDVPIGDPRPATYSSTYSLGMQYSLSAGTLLQPRLARREVSALEQQVESVEAGLEAQVVQGYLSLLQTREAAVQAVRERERALEHVRLAEARVQVGAGTPLDIRRAEVQLGQAEVRVVQTENDRVTQRLQLSQLLGVPLAPEVELVSSFALAEPRLDAAALVELALRSNPALRGQLAMAQLADSRVRVSRAAYLPSMNLSASISGRSVSQVGQEGGTFPFDYNPNPGSISLGLSLPIFTSFNREQQVAEARIAADNARHQLRAQELRVEAEVEAAARGVETAYRVALLQQRVRETAEEELRLARERFRFGAATSVEVMDAQTNLSEAERAEISAIYDYHKSLAGLEALIGAPLR